MLRDLWPWLAVLLVLLASFAWLRLRRRRPTLREEIPGPQWRSRPQPGEIWWAEVPFDDGSGSKVRPCLVLRTHRAGADVLKITSQDRSARADHVEIPTSSWDRRATHNSFLDLSDPYRIADPAFRRKAGRIDAAIWRKVGQAHPTGWVA